MADSARPGAGLLRRRQLRVTTPVLMRRALEYVKAFDGVVAQHAQEPRLTEGAQMNEGELSGRLGLAGWPAVAEEAIIARDCLLAAHVGSRLHVCHVSTAGSVEIIRWAKARGCDVTAEVTPHHLLLTDELAATLRPGLQGQPAAAHRRRRRGAARRRWPTARSTSSPPTTPRTRTRTRTASGPRPRSGMLGLETALSVVQRDDGRHRPARLGRRRRPDVRRARARSAGSPATAARSRRASRPTSCSSTRRAPGRSTARPQLRRRSVAQHARTPAATLPGPACVATFLRGTADRRSTAKLRVDVASDG